MAYMNVYIPIYFNSDSSFEHPSIIQNIPQYIIR